MKVTDGSYTEEEGLIGTWKTDVFSIPSHPSPPFPLCTGAGIETVLNIKGFGISVKQLAGYKGSRETSNIEEEGTEGTITRGFVLSDPDLGDQFDVR